VGPSDHRLRLWRSSGVRRNLDERGVRLPFFCEHVFFFRLTNRAAVPAAANNPNPRGHPWTGIGRSWSCGWQASASSNRSGTFNSLKRASG
jgi:hypothetical protein